jgi:3-oxoacyl-(acyl-carrier-protein) synthase
VEEVCDEAALGFTKLGLTSASRGVHPFGEGRDGTAAGEGSALWMLETEETAASRGQKPQFEICGFGCAHGDAPAAISQALEETGIGADQIACIVASGNGSAAGDEFEARALRTVFNGRLGQIPVTAPKAALGEAMGASGAFGAIVAGLALERQQVPPTAGFSASRTDLRLSASPQPISGEYALVNAFSCEGNSASLVIRLWR